MPKRRQRGEGSLFRRKSDGLWVGRVDLGWVDGRRRRKTVYAQTQAEGVRKLAATKAAVGQGDRSTASMTTGVWLQRWLDDVCPGKDLKPRTLANYRSYVTQYLVPAIGRVRLDRLSPQHVREVHSFVMLGGRSSTTAGHAHRVLSTALNDAVREGVLQRNPVTVVAKPRAAESGRRALTVDEVRRVFAVVEGDVNASRWHTAFLLGLRQGECLGLRWSDVDLDAGTVDVAWQLQRIPWRHGADCGTGDHRPPLCPARELDVQPGFTYLQLEGNLCLQRPKTHGSTRVVPVPGLLQVSLEQHRARTLADLNPHGLVWSQPDGRPIDGGKDRAEWHHILHAAAVPDMDLHSARHTTASLLLALGVPENVIMAILGHTLAVTTRGYAHADLALLRGAMDKLGGALAIEPPTPAFDSDRSRQ